MTSRCARRFCGVTKSSKCVFVVLYPAFCACWLGGLLFIIVLAYPRIVHVHPQNTGTAGAGTTARAVLYGVGMEVGYPGGFGIG